MRFSFLLPLFLAAQACLGAGPLPLPEAEARALRAHPRISAADLRALIAREGVVEARAPFWPILTGNGTLVGTDGDNNRVAAGGLNNPIIYDRGAVGLNVSWLLFDFGRSERLLQAAKLHARAEKENAQATRAQILFLVDSSYYSALGAAAVVRVAADTVNARKTLRDQVEALARNELKSDLDLSFAESALAEAQVLQSRAENEQSAAQTRLAALIGEKDASSFFLEDAPPPSQQRTNLDELIRVALTQRPELARLRLEEEASHRSYQAERALHYPVISAIGVGGVLPEHNPRLPDNYLAAGLNVSVPLFNGFQTESRRKAAALKEKVSSEIRRDEEENVIRDVKIAWLNFQNARDRVGLTEKLAQTAKRAFDLAEARYKAGATSLAELSQAQLNRTSAEIAQASARFELLIQMATLELDAGLRAEK